MATPDKLEIKAALKVLKSVSEVFEAIVDPVKMSNYFIASSTGRMEEGKTITWKFPEFDILIPVRVTSIKTNEYIAYYWDGGSDNTQTLVEITIRPMEGDSSFVTVTEKSKDNDEAGIKWLKQNTEGWANFLACLKASLEYGINLRKGAFDISQMPEKNVLT